MQTNAKNTVSGCPPYRTGGALRPLLCDAYGPRERQLGVSPRRARVGEFWTNLGSIFGEMGALWGGCDRSRCSVREAETVGRGGENFGKRAKKRATSAVFALGVACQLVCRTFRFHKSGSARGTLFVTTLSLPDSVSACRKESCWVRVPIGGIQFGTSYEHYCGSDSQCILNRRALLLLDLDAEEEELADLGFPNFDGRTSKESGELATGEEVVACGAGAEIAKDEVLGHAVVKLSPEKLLVKEKRGSPGNGACGGWSGRWMSAKAAIKGERLDTFHRCRFGFVQQARLFSRQGPFFRQQASTGPPRRPVLGWKEE